MPPLPSPRVADDVLVTIGGENITAEQFSAEMLSRRTADDPKAKKALLDEMIQVRILAREARQHGYDHDPQVAAAYDTLLANRMKQDFHGQAKAGPPEIEAYYAAHQAEFTTPATIRAAVIFVEAPAQLPPEKRTERRAAMDAARQKAQTLPPTTFGFGPVAAEFSNDQGTKYRGGDMGFLTEGFAGQRWEKPVTDAAFALTMANPLSDVITTDRGYYFVKLANRHDAGVRPLSSVRPQIERRLADEKERQLTEQFVKNARDHQPIKIYDDRLAAVVPPKSAKPLGVTIPQPSRPDK